MMKVSFQNVDSLRNAFHAVDMHVLANGVNTVEFTRLVQRDNVTLNMWTLSDASEQNANVSGETHKEK
jgi:hypothetical protein